LQLTTVAAAQELKEKIETHSAHVGVVGLGYVGLPVAVAFARAGFHVTGIDIQQSKIATLNRGKSFSVVRYLGSAG